MSSPVTSPSAARQNGNAAGTPQRSNINKNKYFVNEANIHTVSYRNCESH